MSAVPIPATVRAAVIRRDAAICVRCGERPANHQHHRKLRSRGGKHTLANLITLCTGCHEWVHGNPEKSTLAGYMVPTYADPSQIPVILYRPGFAPWKTLLWCLLDDAGNELHLLDEDAHELLVKFGIWKLGVA